MMKFGSKPGYARGHNKLNGTVLYSYTVLVLLFLCTKSDLVFAQLETGFVLHKFDDKNISCAGLSRLTPHTYTLPGAICLTPNNVQGNTTAGRCFYNNAVAFPKSAKGFYSFSTMFSFTAQVYPTYLAGQGFTFFIGPDDTHVGEDGGYLGWLNSTSNGDRNGHNFAVEFDIVQNQTQGLDDPNDHHVGINVNSLISLISAPLRDFSLTTDSSSDKLHAWIDYHGETGTIEVSLSKDVRKPCKTLISAALPSLQYIFSTPEPMYVGFTSSSGNITKTQTTIWNWSFNTTGKATNIYGKDAHCGGETMSWGAMSALIIAALTVAVLLMLVLIFILHRRTRKISSLEKERADLIAELKQLDYGAREFTYQELSEATKEFKEAVGSGGFGTVYKGSLFNLRSSTHSKGDVETTVAVKKIKRTAETAEDAKQLVAEVKVIGRLRHINMVPLLGWCYERGEMLLVYKYMENGDLDMHLFPNDDGAPGVEVLSWQKRMKILRGVAAAMVFLHEEFDCGQSVVHRDIKTRNVMIDHSFNARLGDFGLARLYDSSSNANHTDVLMGTKGYIAPEYQEMGATTKTDVYSFGVLALVVATGRHALHTTLPEGLVKWVRRMHDEGTVAQCRDVKLKSNDESFNEKEIDKVLRVGLFCCLYEPEARPNMRQVLTALHGMPPILSSPLPPQNPEQVSFLNKEFLSMVSGSSHSTDQYDLSDSDLQYLGRSGSYIRIDLR